ncbi:transcriptional regulator [Streptomyces sp. NPDC047928]|uniref:transcriptional regulator n=1 Tax=unclassified Streptomyces TaxID=2593676 RepID=UPI003710F69F
MSTVVSPMLRRLAVERATGALLRDHGTLYLVDGRVVHAESPVSPGVDVLLTAGGRLPRRGVDGGRAGSEPGGGELEICRLAALYDAAFFALAPGRGPARFRYGDAYDTDWIGAPWPGTVHPVSATSVERETLRRRRLLDRVWPYPAVDTAPVVARPAAPGQRVTPRRRALLAHADGVRTPVGLARVLGRPAFHTVLEVRRLAAAGLVETPPADTAPPPRPRVPAQAGPRDPLDAPAPRPSAPGTQHPAVQGAPHPAGSRIPAGSPAPDRSPLPDRAGAPFPDRAGPPVPPWIADYAPEPDIALLRRLRDALEAHL